MRRFAGRQLSDEDDGEATLHSGRVVAVYEAASSSFWLECGLAFKKNRARKATGISFSVTQTLRDQIKLMLPFKRSPVGANKICQGLTSTNISGKSPAQPTKK